MRAKEFTITVPITINFSGDNEPIVSTGSTPEDEKHLNPVMVPPLQQQLELAKAEQGKESSIIDKLIAPSEIGSEEKVDPLSRIKELISHRMQSNPQ